MSVDQKWQGGPSVSTDRSTGGGNNESEEWSILIDRNAESGHQIFSEEEKKQLDSMAKALVEEAKAGQADDAKPKIQRLLQLIMRSTSKEEDFLESINKFIFYYIKAPEQTYKRNDKIMKDNHVHLLDLMRKILIDQPLQKNKKPNLTETDKKSKYWHSFRNIEELKAAGIKLKPTETSAVRDITFGGGTLNLPPIVVDDSTAAKFLNMAAYEMCPDFQNGFEVSTYISFLDSLIDRAQDVKVLREKKILHNALGSDEDVAKLFNEISTDLVPREEIYLEVNRNIQKYCNSIWRTWFSQFKHDHFHSPWSVLAFVGAFLALASSIIQTVYTVLGYHVDSNR
ncbi:hypothetical protein QYF36_004575 [Acer negundo]|nr:hypothetical protein QYF36_004575 [Acer negundo]